MVFVGDVFRDLDIDSFSDVDDRIKRGFSTVHILVFKQTVFLERRTGLKNLFYLKLCTEI